MTDIHSVYYVHSHAPGNTEPTERLHSELELFVTLEGLSLVVPIQVSIPYHYDGCPSAEIWHEIFECLLNHAADPLA